ncbi:hypothetical protein [Clostridium thermobutyricum]|uniref:hypothetical protein n=1 Tax=Clostridium thermobutyricum TaxID=29372 RepID=UPI0018A9C7A7|nr:hypothetical protein [Clostridium thermobutyricum]
MGKVERKDYIRKKIFIIECLVLIISVIFYKVVNCILDKSNLALMNTPKNIIEGVIGIFLIIILIQIINLIRKMIKNSWISAIVTLIAGIILILIILEATAIFIFGYGQEYIINDKNRGKEVVYVHSFLKTSVDHYDYVNKLVRGNKLKETELIDGSYVPTKN